MSFVASKHLIENFWHYINYSVQQLRRYEWFNCSAPGRRHFKLCVLTCLSLVARPFDQPSKRSGLLSTLNGRPRIWTQICPELGQAKAVLCIRSSDGPSDASLKDEEREIWVEIAGCGTEYLNLEQTFDRVYVGRRRLAQERAQVHQHLSRIQDWSWLSNQGWGQDKCASSPGRKSHLHSLQYTPPCTTIPYFFRRSSCACRREDVA
ncbi:hypothetical protein V8E53_012651 [Lactarius tabidus]